MKRLIILCLMIGGLFALQAQTTKTTPYKGTGAEIQFDKLTVDFGTLKVGDVKTVTITFTNIGKKPLILDDVISSCDCTTVDWSKQPIMPGKKGTIKDPGLRLPAPRASTVVVSKRDLYKSSPMNARTLKKYILQALESTYLLEQIRSNI